MRGLVCVTFGGPVRSIHTSRGLVLFEWHEYCGALPVTRDGSGRSLPPKHPFWKALDDWIARGSQVDEKGKCL